MGLLVVIEGMDGAGKRTLVEGLETQLTGRGCSVARWAFPRYERDVHAELVRDALHGRLGDLADSVHGMAVLYALDRRDAAAELRADLAGHDVVLLDRYVASNAAYGAARSHQDAGGGIVEWVRHLEMDRFELPVPDLQVLLDVPADVAAGRAQRRERTESGRARDLYESDAALQRRCGAVYQELASGGWLSPWQVVEGDAEFPYTELADRILATGLVDRRAAANET